MQISIRTPQWFVRAKSAYLDWANVEVWRGRLFGRECEMRRIDVATTSLFIVCVMYYWYFNGWKGALVGGLMYVFFVMLSLWF